MVNMALRAAKNSSLTLRATSLSHLVGLPVFSHDNNINPMMDWDEWLDLFHVAIIAKYSISMTQLTIAVIQQSPRVGNRKGDLEENPENKKVVSVLYLLLWVAARKHFRDKFPHMTL